MMRVLHVYKSYAPTRGGIESHVRQLATGLARRGVDVSVLVVGSSNRTTVEERERVRVIRAARLGELASTPLSVELMGQVQRIDADLIHLHVPYPPGELAALALGRGRPIVVTYHSDVIRQWWALPLYRPLAHALLRRARAIIATSPPYVRTSSILRSHANRCQIIPLGVDPKRFYPDETLRRRGRQTWLGNDDRPLILFVGKLRAYKGLPHLVDAARSVPARFLLAGSGPLEPELRAQIERMGLTEKVQLIGEVDDAELPDLYRAADIVVLPSTRRSEAFGLVLLEAMASARPIVSTELGTGTSWVNQHERTGLVVPPGDVAALTLALHTLIENPLRAQRYGDAGRERAEAEFTEETMTLRVVAVYERVAAGTPSVGTRW
jgi:rhamnosyl/mannosyltransferase